MNKEVRSDAKRRMEKAIARPRKEKFLFRLFVTGTTPASTAAILNLKKICDEYLNGRYELDVIDIYQHPEAARAEQIVAAPTLIKKLPLPIRRFIGSMTDRERILAGLDLKEKVAPASSAAHRRKPAASSRMQAGRKTARIRKAPDKL